MIHSFDVADSQVDQLMQRINQLEGYVGYLQTQIATLQADYNSLAESFTTFKDRLRNIC